MNKNLKSAIENKLKRELSLTDEIFFERIYNMLDKAPREERFAELCKALELCHHNNKSTENERLIGFYFYMMTQSCLRRDSEIEELKRELMKYAKTDENKENESETIKAPRKEDHWIYQEATVSCVGQVRSSYGYNKFDVCTTEDFGHHKEGRRGYRVTGNFHNDMIPHAGDKILLRRRDYTNKSLNSEAEYKVCKVLAICHK